MSATALQLPIVYLCLLLKGADALLLFFNERILFLKFILDHYHLMLR